MSAEIEIAELRGEVAVLKALIYRMMDTSLDVKLQAINAEAIANRAFEQTQAFIAQFQADASPAEEYGEGVVDTRTGGVSRQSKKEVVSDELS